MRPDTLTGELIRLRAEQRLTLSELDHATNQSEELAEHCLRLYRENQRLIALVNRYHEKFGCICEE